jgi:hypothetical protein
MTGVKAVSAGGAHTMIIRSLAYNKTKAGPNGALLGINYSEAGKDNFKWLDYTFFL